MEFEEINEDSKVYPGEYLLHEPSREIVLCGAYIKNEGKIKAMRQGRLMEDKIENFKKIQMSHAERKERRSSRCKGCSSK
jgi:radical SAM protein with 4Fe4S-binding SPASM domain